MSKLVGVYTSIGPRDTPDRFVTGKLLVGVQFGRASFRRAVRRGPRVSWTAT